MRITPTSLLCFLAILTPTSLALSQVPISESRWWAEVKNKEMIDDNRRRFGSPPPLTYPSVPPPTHEQSLRYELSTARALGESSVILFSNRLPFLEKDGELKSLLMQFRCFELSISTAPEFKRILPLLRPDAIIRIQIDGREWHVWREAILSMATVIKEAVRPVNVALDFDNVESQKQLEEMLDVTTLCGRPITLQINALPQFGMEPEAQDFSRLAGFHTLRSLHVKVPSLTRVHLVFPPALTALRLEEDQLNESGRSLRFRLPKRLSQLMLVTPCDRHVETMLASLDEVEFLGICAPSITLDTFARFSRLAGLRGLSISVECLDFPLTPLSDVRSLEALLLSTSRLVPFSEFRNRFPILPGLKWLQLRGISIGVADRGAFGHLSSYRSLKRLDLPDVVGDVRTADFSGLYSLELDMITVRCPIPGDPEALFPPDTTKAEEALIAGLKESIKSLSIVALNQRWSTPDGWPRRETNWVGKVAIHRSAFFRVTSAPLETALSTTDGFQVPVNWARHGEERFDRGPLHAHDKNFAGPSYFTKANRKNSSFFSSHCEGLWARREADGNGLKIARFIGGRFRYGFDRWGQFSGDEGGLNMVCRSQSPGDTFFSQEGQMRVVVTDDGLDIRHIPGTTALPDVEGTWVRVRENILKDNAPHREGDGSDERDAPTAGSLEGAGQGEVVWWTIPVIITACAAFALLIVRSRRSSRGPS